MCYYAGANGKKVLLWRFDPGALSKTSSSLTVAPAIPGWGLGLGRHRRNNALITSETTYASRRFFFFDDFFSFFFDDGTGVSSGFLFPATCTNEPEAGAAPASFPSRCAFTSSIA